MEPIPLPQFLILLMMGIMLDTGKMVLFKELLREQLDLHCILILLSIVLVLH